MPRILTLICCGLYCLIYSSATAQILPRNPTIQQVVSYHVYQQNRWNNDQLPKNSIQYKVNSNIFPRIDIRISTAAFHLYPLATPEAKKSFAILPSQSAWYPRTYLESSRFLKLQWQKVIQREHQQIEMRNQFD